MSATLFDSRPTLPTIRSTRQAVEDYWEEYGPGADPAASLDDALDPLDGFLVHQLLDFLPPGVVVVDMAAAATRGASTAVALAHPSPKRVLAAAGDDGDALREYARGRRGGPAFDVLASPHLPADLAARHGLVVLADARGADPDDLAKSVFQWLSARPDAVAVVFGVGLVGEAGALDELLAGCRAGSGRRLWLARELGEALVSSRVAVVARQGHPHADNALVRLTQSYTGNVRYLDLLWDLNQSAIRAAGADLKVLHGHPSGDPVLHEINKHKAAADEAKRECEYLRAEVHRLGGEVHAAHGMVLAREHDMAALRASAEYRNGQRVKRVRQWFAPDGSIRHRAIRKARRGAQILRAEGVGSFLKWTIGRRPGA